MLNEEHGNGVAQLLYQMLLLPDAALRSVA
jgi:hypothetical protein